MKVVKVLLLVATIWSGLNFASAQTWTPSGAPSINWNGLASSADGCQLFALGPSWKYYVSTNSGTSWATNDEPKKGSGLGSWAFINSSADGTKLVTATAGSQIWVSTNSGDAWLSNNVAGVTSWQSAALSADGTKIVAVDGRYSSPSFSHPGFIYTSTNWGISWTPTSAPSNYWSSVACSADGNKIVAVASSNSSYVSPGSIYTSTNAGFTWTNMDAPNTNLVSVASSADGTKLVIASPSFIYSSTNSGVTWCSNNVPNAVWVGVASSADGEHLVAISQGINAIYTSTNSGSTWISNSVPHETWYGVTSSADGNSLAAISVFGIGGAAGHLYTSYSIPNPQLNLTALSNNLAFAWTIPSTNFVLQQSLDLQNWTNSTITPTLNLTNLQEQVIVSPTNASSFYRLTTP